MNAEIFVSEENRLPVARKNSIALFELADKSSARASHREIRALEPDVKAKRNYTLNLNSTGLRQR